MSDMANSDLEKYAKALDKSVLRVAPIIVLTCLQRDYEVPRAKDGGSQRYHEAPLEQDVSGHRYE
jgi:hypothetical protein